MCVILAVNKDAKDVSMHEWDAAQYNNNDGYGIAWIKDGLVHFKKAIGSKIDALREFRPPKPYVMHFRLATVGTEITEMCHPFIVSPKSKGISFI